MGTPTFEVVLSNESLQDIYYDYARVGAGILRAGSTNRIFCGIHEMSMTGKTNPVTIPAGFNIRSAKGTVDWCLESPIRFYKLANTLNGSGGDFIGEIADGSTVTIRHPDTPVSDFYGDPVYKLTVTDAMLAGLSK